MQTGVDMCVGFGNAGSLFFGQVRHDALHRRSNGMLDEMLDGTFDGMFDGMLVADESPVCYPRKCSVE